MIYLTEEEARRKWCPFAAPERSERGFQLDRATCIAGECMSWRWKQPSDVDEQNIRHMARDTDRASAEHRFRKKSGGYCGLAGKPSQ